MQTYCRSVVLSGWVTATQLGSSRAIARSGSSCSCTFHRCRHRLSLRMLVTPWMLQPQALRTTLMRWHMKLDPASALWDADRRQANLVLGSICMEVRAHTDQTSTSTDHIRVHAPRQQRRANDIIPAPYHHQLQNLISSPRPQAPARTGRIVTATCDSRCNRPMHTRTSKERTYTIQSGLLKRFRHVPFN